VLPLPANDEGNAIAFAAAGEPVMLDIGGLRAECERLARETGIRWGASVTRLEQAVSIMLGRSI
jgi:hypothetical protein